jgi:hypothetical protein
MPGNGRWDFWAFKGLIDARAYEFFTEARLSLWFYVLWYRIAMSVVIDVSAYSASMLRFFTQKMEALCSKFRHCCQTTTQCCRARPRIVVVGFCAVWQHSVWKSIAVRMYSVVRRRKRKRLVLEHDCKTLFGLRWNVVRLRVGMR